MSNKKYMFIGIIIGFKAILLLYIYLVLFWINIWELDLWIMVIFGLINGFIDSYLISNYDEFNQKIISCIFGIVSAFLFFYIFWFIMDYVYNYINYTYETYPRMEPINIFIVFFNMLFFSVLISFPITTILIWTIKKIKYNKKIKYLIMEEINYIIIKKGQTAHNRRYTTLFGT